jgi:ubiquinone/menaquinone biosynthesis C-methylase UbiE
MIDYNKITEHYTQHRQNVHPEVLKGLLMKGNLENTSNVLEVGCGTANYIIAVQSITGSNCWGIDPSEKMLSVARERSSDIIFELGRAEKLDFPSDFFDLIFSVDVIHHVEGHLDYFQEAFRTLKPGESICTSTDSEWVLRNRRPLSTHFPETVEVELARYPRISTLSNLMRQSGFSRIEDNLVEFSFDLKDIQSYRDRAFSSLHLISEEAFQRGIAQLERELNEKGFIHCKSRYTLLWGNKSE